MCLTLPLYGKVNQNKDFQVWASWILQKKLSEKWSTHLMTEYRYGHDAKEMYLMFSQLTFSYAWMKWLSVIPGYRQRWSADPVHRGAYVPLYEPIFALTLHFEKNGWKLSDRNRVDYVIVDGGDDAWIYRNKFSLTSPWKMAKAKCVPYFEDEFFWVEKSGIAQNRVWIGGIFEFSDHFSGKLSYLLRHLKLPRGWRHQNALGLQGIYTF